MHPSDEIRGEKSKILINKKIVLGITGSIASVECVKLARELIRHGAEVFPVMTRSAIKIIHPDAIEFATGNKPIIDLTGKTEHITFCGDVKKPADLFLISPCTANTISKITYGIDDTSVTTFATTAIGSGMPVLIASAMHLSMYNHKIIQKNIKKCKKIGIKFIEPKLEGNKAKIASVNEIVDHSIRELNDKDMKNIKILIIGGSTNESIDDVRFISNNSSGKTAISLVKNAFYRGAHVELWYGCSYEPIPSYISNIKFRSVYNLIDLIDKKDIIKFDIIIVCAAISDFIMDKKKGKISSSDKIKLELIPAPKIISKLRKKTSNSIIVGFKLDSNKKLAIDKSNNLIKVNKLDYVIANLISDINTEQNKIWIVNKTGKYISKVGTKNILANHIFDIILKDE
jgi:phosphopantothenoylcysteine decarboxylase/phosphopantothenate--cysteine ligase